MRSIVSLFLAGAAAACAGVIEVRDAASLRAALSRLEAGDVLKIHGGEYPGGFSLSEREGITIEAADPEQPPHFKGGKVAWHFTRCAGLTVRHLHCSGQSHNGINVDEGGPERGPAAGITLENLVISDIGPTGNFDGIKCSGLADLVIRDCTISGWGGQAIDLVGCRRVLISGCRILGKPGFSQHTGPQFKGGCEDVTIENCVIIDAGMRPIQAGGSTGLAYIRPPGARYEARRIIIRNNRIEGGDCAATFTGVDGAEFSGNTVLRPQRWIFQILTETREPGFPPARNVRISGNTFVFRAAQVQQALNIGPHTEPETFTFSNNIWYAEDRPEASRLRLPVEEEGGTYGKPPEL
jgi:hypothetical protein